MKSGATPTSTAHGPGAFRPSPSDGPSRAGSRAGEGRERPGREKGPLEDEEAVTGREPDRDEEGDGSTRPESEGEDDGGKATESSEAAGDASAPATHAVPRPVTHAEDRAEPVLQVLPLGTGLVLIGLGLGLAFVGLRLRRG
ncbi:hypothetical protein ACFZAV_15595 [Streptomyces sp. NPDC008343]|uniref:hypothetical protein n=1 Tax=Streptomyces sp. NPDC008343 TaxID=3364828 RepID=UPI0036EF7BFF